MPAVLFPDVEAWLIGFFKAALAARPELFAAAVKVTNHVDNPTGRTILVRDDGGPVLGDVRGVARLGVNVWADTHEEASDLANLASALLGGAADGAPVVRVSTTRPYSVTDEAGKPRQYFTAELVVRGVSI